VGIPPRAAAVGVRVKKRTVEWNGESRTLDEWVVVTGLKKSTIQNRLNNGWPIARALGRPASSRSEWNGNATMTSQKQSDLHREMHSCPCAQCRPMRATVKPRTSQERAARMVKEVAARAAWRQSVRGRVDAVISMAMAVFAALSLSWRVFWQVARLRLEGGEIVTVTVEAPTQPMECHLCGQPSRCLHPVSRARMCEPCAIRDCVEHNSGAQRRVH
jgi:hypothetical protein